MMHDRQNAFFDPRRLALCAAFLLGALAVDRAIGGALTSALRRVDTGQAIGLANAALKHRDAEIIIFGNSRARHGLMPSVLTEQTSCSAYNAGLNGQGLYYHRMLEALLLSEGTSAKLFVLLADPGTLMFSHRERALNMTPFVDDDETVDTLVRQITRFSGVKLLSRAYRFNGTALAILGNLARPERSSTDGYVPLTRHKPREGRLERAEVVPSAIRAEVQPDLVGLVRDFVETAQDHGIDVVLLEGPALRRLIEDAPARAALRRVAADRSVPLLTIDEENREEFLDRSLYSGKTHLNPKGAELFSSLLAEGLLVEDLPQQACASTAQGTLNAAGGAVAGREPRARRGAP